MSVLTLAIPTQLSLERTIGTSLKRRDVGFLFVLLFFFFNISELNLENET